MSISSQRCTSNSLEISYLLHQMNPKNKFEKWQRYMSIENLLKNIYNLYELSI